MLRIIGRRVIPILVTTLTIAACTNVIDGRPQLTQSAPTPSGVAPSPTPAPTESIHWRQCKSPKSAECGELVVPIDYAKPDSGDTTIALIRFKATGNKIGSLLVNPGGPGGSGIEYAAAAVRMLPKAVREHFDLVGFDPRGVGSSQPAVRCNSDADIDKERADPQVDYSPEGVARIEKLNQEYVQRCVDKMGLEFLANVGTLNVVKDMDRLRAALGDEKLTYAGFSYGTELGWAYAEAFPQNVRAMLLDGPTDPDADPVDSDIRQVAAFQIAFDDYAADCAKSPDCPLGTDPKKAVDVFHSLIDPLVDHPATTKDPRGLSYSDALTATFSALYSQSFWEDLTSGLTALKNRDGGDDLLALADQYWQRNEDGTYSNLNDANLAVTCGDVPYPRDPQTWVEMDRREREAAPFQSFGQFTGNAPRGVCAFWPVGPAMRQHTISAPGLPPVLVVATTHDPATPYEDGVHLAEQLHGTLLTVEGTQHTATFEGDTCVDDIATAYLVDLTLPPPDSRC